MEEKNVGKGDRVIRAQINIQYKNIRKTKRACDGKGRGGSWIYL